MGNNLCFSSRLWLNHLRCCLKSELFFCLSHLSCHFRCDISVCVWYSLSAGLWSALPCSSCCTSSHCPSVQTSSGLVHLAFAGLSKVKIEEETLCFSFNPGDFTCVVCLRAVPGHPGGASLLLAGSHRKPEFLLSEGGIAFLHRGRSGSWFCFTHQETSPAELLW